MQIHSVEARVVRDSPGVQYIVTLGNWQKWLVYCSQPVALQWVNNKLSSSSPIVGYVRVAVLPAATYLSAFEVLLQYVQMYPTCGSVTVEPPQAGPPQEYTGYTAVRPGPAGEASLTFQYSTVGSGELLMLALPHQVDSLLEPSLDSASNKAVLAYSPIWCIKGKMRPIVGDTWRLRVPLVTANWNYEVPGLIPTERLDLIAQALLGEVHSVFPQAPDPYGFGKELGRMASLALIADDLGIPEARATALGVLEKALSPWLTGDNPNALHYDTTYGGLVTTNGIADKMGDYGQVGVRIT
jgi:endo-1,3(4)-beta-glucanase